MAKITKSADAPTEPIDFNIGGAVFHLEDGTSVFETDNQPLIANAKLNKWLAVEEDVVVPSDIANDGYDPNDPHDNPRADALSLQASPAAVAAAQANNTAIQTAAGIAQAEPVVQPTVAEQKDASFDALGIATAPELAVPVDAPATEAPSTPPAEAPAKSVVVTTPADNTTTPATSTAGSAS